MLLKDVQAQALAHLRREGVPELRSNCQEQPPTHFSPS